MTKIYSLVDINTQETTKPKSEVKLTGLTRRYKKIDYVLQIEKLWEKYALALDSQEKENAIHPKLTSFSKP